MTLGSQSNDRLHANCPWAARESRLGIHRDASHPVFQVGRAFHAEMEAALLGKARPEFPALSDGDRAGLAKTRRRAEELGLPHSAIPDGVSPLVEFTLIGEVNEHGLVEEWEIAPPQAERGPSWDPSAFIADGRTWRRVQPDLAWIEYLAGVPTVIAVDWKRGSSTSRVESAERDQQAAQYLAAFCRYLGVPQGQFRWCEIHQDPAWVVSDVKTVEWWEGIAQRAWRAHRAWDSAPAEEFEAWPGAHCATCPQRYRCPLGSQTGADDGNPVRAMLRADIAAQKLREGVSELCRIEPVQLGDRLFGYKRRPQSRWSTSSAREEAVRRILGTAKDPAQYLTLRGESVADAVDSLPDELKRLVEPLVVRTTSTRLGWID